MAILKNTRKTVYATKYPVLWKRLLNLLEDCVGVKPEQVTEKSKFIDLGLSGEDCAELLMNLEAATDTFGYAESLPAELPGMTTGKLMDVITTKTQYHDLEY